MPNTKLQEKNHLANQLAKQEKIILRKAKEWYLEGKALLEIRDKKLYLGKYLSFADYCKNKWGFSKRYANMQITGYSFVSRLGTMVPTLPANERQARSFTGLNPDLQKAAWLETIRTAPNGKITSDHADAVAKKYNNGSQQLGTKAGTETTENTIALTSQALRVSGEQQEVNLLRGKLDEALRTISQVQYERDLWIIHAQDSDRIITVQKERIAELESMDSNLSTYVMN